jgi:hypothetical protein
MKKYAILAMVLFGLYLLYAVHVAQSDYDAGFS